MMMMMNLLRLPPLKNSSKSKDHAHTVMRTIVMMMSSQSLLNPRSLFKAKLIAHIATKMTMMMVMISLRKPHPSLLRLKVCTTQRVHPNPMAPASPTTKHKQDLLLPPLDKSKLLPPPHHITLKLQLEIAIHYFGMTLLKRMLQLKLMPRNKNDYNHIITTNTEGNHKKLLSPTL